MEMFTNITNGFVEDILMLRSKQPPSPLQEGRHEEIKRDAPNTPGIYAIFHKDNLKCFYVGSSVKSIRERLKMHYGKDAKKDYREKLGQLRNPENFYYWYYEIVCPTTLDKQDFKCLIAMVEAMCSAAWKPDVPSYKF